MSKVNLAVHDLLSTIIDTIEALSDPVTRLDAYQYLDKQMAQRVVPERDRAAYEARERYPARVIVERASVDVSSVYYWADRHRLRTGAERVSRRARPELDTAIDLDL